MKKIIEKIKNLIENIKKKNMGVIEDEEAFNYFYHDNIDIFSLSSKS